MKAFLAGLAMATGLLAGGAQAASVPFSDDFDSYTPALNYGNFGPWETNTGTVDIVASGTYGITCYGGTGNCVDLDGSTNDPGQLSVNFDLAANTTYSLSFALSGNQRGYGSDTVKIAVNLGFLLEETITLSSSDPWQLYTFTFTTDGSPATFSAPLSFQNNGGDNVGILLDSVSVAAVPVPAAGLLLLGGLGGLAALRRRGKKAA